MPIIKSQRRSRDFVKLDWATRFFYYELCTQLDPSGHYSGEPEVLLSELFPLERGKVRLTDVERWLKSLKLSGNLRHYADSKGRMVVEVPDAIQKKMKNLQSDYEAFNGGQSSLLLEQPPPEKPVFKKSSAKPEGGKASLPSFSSFQNSVSEDPRILDELATDFITVITGLIEDLGTACFGRKPGQPPTYEEQRTALEVVKRPDWRAEKVEIEVFNRKVLPTERRYVFPGTLFKLLNDWNSALDQARNYTPKLDKSGTPTSVDIGPKLAEVIEYARQKGDGYEVVARAFHDYWTERGWRRQNGHAVDWQIALGERIAASPKREAVSDEARKKCAAMLAEFKKKL